MEWTAIESATVGSVIAMALLLIYRFLGQRTDPKLLELFKLQTTANAERDEAQNNAYERLANSYDRNTETLATVKTGIETAFTAFAKSIQQMVDAATTEHAQQFVAIGNIPGAILPAIDTLAQQIEDQKGSVLQMDTKVKDQSGSIQQVLEAILRLEKQVENIATKFDTFQSESKKLGDEIQDTKKEIVSIKGDVEKLKPTPKPTDDDPKAETE